TFHWARASAGVGAAPVAPSPAGAGWTTRGTGAAGGRRAGEKSPTRAEADGAGINGRVRVMRKKSTGIVLPALYPAVPREGAGRAGSGFSAGRGGGVPPSR